LFCVLFIFLFRQWWQKTAPPLQHPAVRGKDLARQQRYFRASSQQQQQQPHIVDFESTFHPLDHEHDEMAHTALGFDPHFLRNPPINPHHPNPHYDIEALPQDQQAVIIQERAVQPWRDILQANPRLTESFPADKLPEGLAVAIEERNKALQSVEELRDLGENIQIGGHKTPCATAVRMSQPRNTARITRTSLAAGGGTPATSPREESQEVTPATPSMTKAQLLEVIEEHLKERAKLLEIIDNLHKNVGNLEEQIRILGDSNNLKLKKNKEVLKKLKGHYITQYFRTCKFVRNEADAKTLANGMYKLMFPERDDSNAKDKEHRIVWVNTYTPHMHPIVNARRSYIQSQCKLACFNYYKKHKKMPALDDILRCCKREMNLEEEEDRVLFEWYWSDIACKFFGKCPFFFVSPSRFILTLPIILCAQPKLLAMTSGVLRPSTTVLCRKQPLIPRAPKQFSRPVPKRTSTSWWTTASTSGRQWPSTTRMRQATGRQHSPKRSARRRRRSY
jgi:hypothetical protein